MAKIEWTKKTWNPIRGCSIVSKGCTNCYAMRQAHRFSGPGKPYEGLTQLSNGGPVWTGEVRLVDSALTQPLKWRKPSLVFVNSMSDLFHDDVPDEFLDAVFAVMALCPQHQFQVLTKRPERMTNYLSDPECYNRILEFADSNIRRFYPHLSNIGISDPKLGNYTWIWLGVSVEDQETADFRIQQLIKTPAALRFVSCEPLLEQIDLHWYLHGSLCSKCRKLHQVPGLCDCGNARFKLPLHWVIVGGESGPGARTTRIDWIRSIKDQCTRARVPVFVKQLGRFPVCPDNPDFSVKDRKGGNPDEWPKDLRVREWPQYMDAPF